LKAVIFHAILIRKTIIKCILIDELDGVGDADTNYSNNWRTMEI